MQWIAFRLGNGFPPQRRLRSALLACLLALALIVPAGAAAQEDPGGNEYSEAALPLKGHFFGFSGISQAGDLSPTANAQYVAAAGGNMTRTPIHWQALEPKRDKYSEPAFDKYEQLYSALRGRGITPIFVIQYAPAWARDPGDAQGCGAFDYCHFPPAEAELGEWQQFVAEVSRRFPQAAIEVWNEPNYASQWRPAPDPARYARLLAAADEAVHEVNPGARVFAGGLATSEQTGWLTPQAFLAGAYAATPSLRDHTDAINIHLYPSLLLGAGSPFAGFLEAVRAVRDANGDHAKPLLVSELGATTGGEGAFSQVQQGDLILRAVRRLMTMNDVLGALVYRLAEPNDPTIDERERGFGVLRVSDGLLGPKVTPKLAYCGLLHAGLLPDLNCPPETKITAAPPPIVASGQVQFGFSSPGAVSKTFVCSLDGSSPTPCTSPASYTVGSGAHTFEVRSRDALGRVDPFPSRSTFVLPAGPRALKLKLSPRQLQLAPGRGSETVKALVKAPGATDAIAGVKVCLKASRSVRVRGKGCHRLGTLVPGASLPTKFKVGLAASARGSSKLTFTASGADATGARKTARVRAKHN